MLEAEIKIPLPKSLAHPPMIVPADAQLVEEVEQVDTYFQHPARNFAGTDEALRLRRQGSLCLLTYKGPRRAGQVKAREELEVSISCAGELREILQRVGFRPAATVRKTRTIYRWQQFLLCLDRVDELGWFVEIEATELLVREGDWQGELQRAAQRLGFDPAAAIGESYLELLLRQKKEQI